MRKLVVFIFVSAHYTTIRSHDNNRIPPRTYNSLWKDISTRPLPQWYDAAKIGIFIHWGVYSVPSTFEDGRSGSEWFWFDWRIQGDPKLDDFMKKNYGPNFRYMDFARLFTAELFDPDEWAQLFAEAGAKYVVLTSKHHDGFTLFPSNRNYWNSVDVGPKKDIVRVLSNSIRKYGMKFGVYYSLLEWFNKMYVQDKKANGHTTMYVETVVWPEIKYLIKAYKPSVLWADGDWDLHESYWKGLELLAWIYNRSPVKDEIVVNDRWGRTGQGHIGDFYTHGDRFNSRILMPHKWENCFTLDKKSWGYRHKMAAGDIMTIDEVLEQVVSTVSCGGNVLINVGPMANGLIPPVFKRLLLRLGKWLEVNGEAIYDTSPWVQQRDSLNPDVWYTCKKAEFQPLDPTKAPEYPETIIAIYIILLSWPRDNILRIHDLSSYLIIPEFHVFMIHSPANCSAGYDGVNKTVHKNVKNCLIEAEHQVSGDIVEVYLPEQFGRHAWVLKVLLTINQTIHSNIK